MNRELPAELDARVRDLLLQRVMLPEERKTLLVEAFWLRDRRLLGEIDLSGKPNDFLEHCIGTLCRYGCLPEEARRRHALSVLLQQIYGSFGADVQKDLDAIVEVLDETCREAEAAQYQGDLLETRRPSAVSIQGVDTPRTERVPTVFLSGAWDGGGNTRRLIESLNTAGHVCWLPMRPGDSSAIPTGSAAGAEWNEDKWSRSVSEGMNNSYAVVALVDRESLGNPWMGREVQWAKSKNKRFVVALLEDVAGDDRFETLQGFQAFALHRDYEAELSRLPGSLPRPSSPLEGSAVRMSPGRRERELDYLDGLRYLQLLHTEKYTPLAGASQLTKVIEPRSTKRVEPVVMRPEFLHTPWSRDRERQHETRRFEDAVDELLKIRRAVLLGEPGAGKTTTLWKLARRLVDDALDDPKKPIPLLVRLGHWTKADQPLADFIAGELGELGEDWGDLVRETRAALLLDGLNEIPPDQRKDKGRQVQNLAAEQPRAMVVVTCREQDYTIDLEFDRVAIAPLDPLRIREFVMRYLGDADGEALFWKLAGETAKEQEGQFRDEFSATLPNWEHVFWVEPGLPADLKWGYENWSWESWARTRERPDSLLVLARNPYMLFMLIQVYGAFGDLPRNRGRLFGDFVTTLLRREGVPGWDSTGQHFLPTTDASELMRNLGQLAYAMQTSPARTQSADDQDATVITSVPSAQAREVLTERQLRLAASASILSVSDEMRFTHQLLQEYFTARYMQAEVEAGRLRAGDLWKPDRWWERTNWEEATVLLAGLYEDDCTPVLNWVGEANPEVAAQCIAGSGAHTPEETLIKLRHLWLPRLTDLDRDPDPRARAAIGRALGMFMLDELPLDNREGVSIALTPSPPSTALRTSSPGERGERLPDIDWVDIPAGWFIYGGGIHLRLLRLPQFRISRYLITYAQFQAFIDAPDGFRNPRWWDGLSADDDHKRSLDDQYFKYWNHPRDDVSWYDAAAFCRWLSEKLGFEVSLPTEQQWEKAARGAYGRVYPYKGWFNPAKANTRDTGIGQTSAVGIFPNGSSPYGVMDMSGNVWEWCLNEFDSPSKTQLAGDERRVLRGGSWFDNQDDARASFRDRINPDTRYNLGGFRVVSAPVSEL